MRYTVSTWIQIRNPSEFPWGTFVVNISGAFLIGLLMTIFVDHFKINPHWRYFLIVGILGGYTTFSALSWEVYELYSVGASVLAAGYFVASAMGGTATVASRRAHVSSQAG